MNNEGMKTHKDLHVWQKAMDLVVDVYEITNRLPQSELYGLTSQIRRSAVSIPSNIAEGAGRNYDKEFIQFLYIALGSIAELETQLLLVQRLKFVETIQFEKLYDVKKMLLGLIKSLKTVRSGKIP